MGLLHKDTFVCLDCETTGLDPQNDRIIEIALVRFDFECIIETFETLIDPQVPIPEISTSIHHITDQMVQGKPKITEVLPKIFAFISRQVIVGHGINMDLTFLSNAVRQNNLAIPLISPVYIDTLRLARLYGESPINSLEMLRQHFNIAEEGAHRAMNDVVVNIEVFKYLSKRFKTTEQILERLKSPILLKAMPLGKHKGRPFPDIPIEYLQWAVHQNFDQDLLFSIKNELKKRKQGTRFGQASNPFSAL